MSPRFTPPPVRRSLWAATLTAGGAPGYSPAMTLLSLLLSCGEPTPDTKPTATTPTTAPTGDTPGPDLPACTPKTGSSGRIALSGVVLAPEGPVAGSVVYDPGGGDLLCVGDCDTTDVTVVCTDGVISPGLIDLHNHLQYNILPPIQVEPEFTDRYEWRGDDRYWSYRTAYDEIYDSYSCEIMKWAEMRELIHGTTAAVGSSGGSCINLLVRNLDEDEDAHGLDGYILDYSSSTVTDSLAESDGEYYRDALSSGNIDAVLNHVAEAKDGAGRSEIEWMFDVGLAGPGNLWVHATDITTEDLARLAEEGAGLLWSPRSNLALYGTTTPVDLATKMGVPWVIGTDWTPSGTMAPTRELACAEAWLAGKGSPVNDVGLWEKSTSEAARLANLDGRIGSLTPGLRADLAVFGWSRYPYRQVIGAGAEDVRLVVVGGTTLYGATGLVEGLVQNRDWCEAIDPCGESRLLCVQAADSGEDAQSYGEIESTLTAALSGVVMPAGFEYGAELYPLFRCVDDPEVCSLAEPTDADPDGDGVIDGDLCADLYDPEQWDTDGDGLGDSCDPCPLATGDDCDATASDADGDGIANDLDNCEYDGNPDQADGDGDGIGDLCDPCPEEAGAACSVTLDQIRDPSHSTPVAEGSAVRLSGLVVTAIRPEQGFFLQDPALDRWAGINVYDQGANVVALGDQVDIEATYIEYYGMSELTDVSSLTVTGSTSVPAAVPVSACDVATTGLKAEEYENMLVEVGAVTVSVFNVDDPEDYDEFEVEDCLRVDDYLWEELDNHDVGTSFTMLRGVLVYGYDNFKVAPRDAGDLY